MVNVGGDSAKLGVIIVTHNGGRFMSKNMQCLTEQTRPPDVILIVDSGSDDPSYLRPFEAVANVRIRYEATDVGFCRGNNLAAAELIDEMDYLLFLNPDAFLTKSFLAEAMEFFSRSDASHVGGITGTLLGYDIERDAPTGKLDSTGIFRTWYGRWYDRGQGMDVEDYLPPERPQPVPAICGALMLLKTAAVREVLLRGREVFDERLFMWKDDVDLSLRIRKVGWQLLYVPSLKAYHCRGWNRDRSKMPRRDRLLSARNDVRLCLRNRSPYLVYALAKYAYVALLERPWGR